MSREQQAALARPFKRSLIHTNPSGGGSYVKHGIVTQKVLAVVGEAGFKFELVEVLRGYVPGVAPNPQASSKRGRDGVPPLDNAVVGAVMRLSLMIDGAPFVIEEVGDCEQPHNWPHDGARLKDATSDAFKRCAMRVGVGLHLWCPDDGEFFLFDLMDAKDSGSPASPSGDAARAPQDEAGGGDGVGGAAPPAASTRKGPPAVPKREAKS